REPQRPRPAALALPAALHPSDRPGAPRRRRVGRSSSATLKSMGSIGPMELLLLGLLAVVIFGPAKLPEIGRSIGRATREFKESISGTGIQEALDGVGDIRSAMSPTNLAKAAMPEMASGVADVKETF